MYPHRDTKDEPAYVDEHPDADMEGDIGDGRLLDLVQGAKVCTPELWIQSKTNRILRKNGSGSEHSIRYYREPTRKMNRIYSHSFHVIKIK